MPNLLLERTEVEELIIDFDIDQFIPEEEGGLTEICVQQGIDASAKKSPSRPKGGRKAKKSPMSRGAQLRKKHGSAAQGWANKYNKSKGKTAAFAAERAGKILSSKEKGSNPVATAKSIARNKRKQAKRSAANSKNSRGAQLRKKHGSAAKGWANKYNKSKGKTAAFAAERAGKILSSKEKGSNPVATAKSIARNKRKQVKRNRASLSKETLRALDDF